MKAVILAGGFGKRMGDLANKIPKPMIEIKNKPLLEHQIELFKKYKIRELLICVHHLPKKIMDYFEDGSEFGVHIRYSMEEDAMGTAGALKLAEDFFDERAIVMYGDNFTDMNLDNFAKFHAEKKSFAAIALHKKKITEKSSSAVIMGNDSRITKFIERPDENNKINELKKFSSEFRYVNAGIYIIEPEIMSFIPKKKFDFGCDLFPLLLEKNKNIYGYPIPENEIYREIGTLEKLNALRKDVERKEAEQ